MASPARLVCGARPALLAVLCCSGFWGCIGDTGELFPATAAPLETPSEEPPPADDAALAAGEAIDGVTEPAPLAPSREGSEPEQPAPVELDPTTAGPSGATPSESPAGGDGEPPPAEQVPPAPPAPVDEPLPPVPDDAVAGEATAIARVCASVDNPLLLDFTSPGSDPTQALFGDFLGALSGGTYVYPNVDENAQQAAGLRSDVTAGDWHISGSVTQQAGFGLFLDCQLLDASRFTGLAFRVSGRVDGTGTITLLIGTAENDVSRDWLVENDGTSVPGSGRCTPVQNEFDGSCNQARIEIPVSRQSREVLVPFAALGQGSPEPGVNPAEITTIGWALPSPAVNRFDNANAYAIDLRIDDIRFIEGPAAAAALDSDD